MSNPGRVRRYTKTVVTEGLANKLIPRDPKFSHFCCSGEVSVEKRVIDAYRGISEMGRVQVHSRRMDSGKEETTHDQQRQLHGQGVSDQSRLKAASQRSEHGVNEKELEVMMKETEHKSERRKKV